MDMIKNLETQAEKKKFNLNDLIPDELRESARAAGRAAKMRDEETEWHRQNDPNFEELYAEECRKTDEEWEKHSTNLTIAEFDEIYKHCRGL